jgi:hypothetical protein
MPVTMPPKTSGFTVDARYVKSAVRGFRRASITGSSSLTLRYPVDQIAAVVRYGWMETRESENVDDPSRSPKRRRPGAA